MNIYSKQQRFKKQFKQSLLLLSFLLISFSFISLLQLNNLNSQTLENYNYNKIDSASEPNIMFAGNEVALNITDYGNLYKANQEISVNNQEEVNLTYYLDDIHNWQISKIQTEINNIQDTRMWVNNSDFLPIIIFRVNETHENSPHPYQSNRGKLQTLDPITHSGAIAMRVHFTRLSFEDGYDYFFIEDQNDIVFYTDTGNKTDFFSPWIRGEELNCYFQSDGSVPDWGYKIDYYEFVNSSSNYEINSNDWAFDSTTTTNTNYGSGKIEGVDSMFVALNSELSADGDYWDSIYYDNDYSELCQNFTIPRGKVIDAYISFDYYAQYAMDSNENFIYYQINNKKVYSKGLGDINELGKNTWHSSGLINMVLWSNTSSIFESILENNEFNISVGIMSGSTIIYSGFEDQYQQVFWFDNISLILTTLANSSQSDISLEFNNNPLIQKAQWGSSYLNLTGNWHENPVILTVTTSSPSLYFELNTTLYGFHDTTSKVGQTTIDGISYEILENGTIIWEFSHNFYMPAQYSDFEFTIEKPENWNFISALDPTLQNRAYEFGNEGDLILRINKENALFPGWWTFRATSPNYLNIINTKLLKQGEWTDTTFNTDESTIIKTQVNYSNEIPLNLDLTSANLTIYDPDGLEWFFEAKTPLSNGTVFFSEIYFDALNTTGGRYDYTLFWSNGTSLGGLNSSFLVVHESSFTLLKPNDAISDLITDAFVGDIIPVRLKLVDSENGDSISKAIISYNWTSGTQFFEEAALGIYETILDTSDLGSNGLYEILIESIKVGFLDYNLTLKINLGEETSLQRLQSDYNIELHANSTIRFRYYSLFDGEGIDGANVAVNITNPNLYFITNSVGGYYDIEFNTSFTNDLGIFQLNFNFSAPSFEPQTHIYQFEIVEQSITITSYINNIEVAQNSIIDVIYMEEINISAQATALIDNILLTGGNFTWIINSYQQSLDEYSGYWYNMTIQINPLIYSPGLNLIRLKFEMEKYQTELFYFQLLVYEQPVDLSVYINSEPISENEIIQLMYMQSINVSVRAFANIELDYINNAVIMWHGGNQDQVLTQSGSEWYNASIQIVPSNYTPGLNSIAIEFIKDDYQNEIFYLQLLVAEQSINLSLYLNSNSISEDQLVEVMFKQNITISARAYGKIDLNYIDDAVISWNSEKYFKNFIEYGGNWYNLSFILTALNFSSGINTVSIKFQKQNYSTTYFSFQLLVREQSVKLNASINNQSILENALVEVMFKDNITIAAQAYATGEGIYLSGGNITLIGESFIFNLYEEISNPTWFTISIIIDGAYFDLGINTISIRFKQDNYTEAYFSFQFFITAETVNLSLYIDSNEISANSLIQVTYYDEFSISLRALANAEKIYLEGGSAIFVIGSYTQDFVENANFWYNISIICDPLNFDLGINTVYVRFIHPNYTSSTFYFQILVNQIEMSVITIDFQDSIEGYSGDSLVVRINLTESISANIIENATISYSWEFGLGNFNYIGNGIYEVKLFIPENIRGSFKVSLIISTNNILYKVKQTSFIIIVSPKELPNLILWFVLIGLSVLISVLGGLSIRSYVLIPRRRKKEASLLSRTQKFKDLQNIQAIVIMHRYSGIPLFAKSYSILEKQKKELFSGFIQAITTIGEEIVGKRSTDGSLADIDESDKSRTILELDFKYFYCLICDRQELRIVFVLKDKPSDRVKKQISDLSLGLMLQLGQEIEKWDGSIDQFGELMPPIISNYIELSYKEPFILNSPAFIADARKEMEINAMEKRVLNVIYSMAKSKKEFYLDHVVESVHEDNKDLVIDALETLVQKRILVPQDN